MCRRVRSWFADPLLALLWGLVGLILGAIMFALIYFGRQSL